MPRDHIGKAFALRRAMPGQILGGQAADVGNFCKGQPLMRAKVLFPQPVIQRRGAVGPKGQRRLDTAQGRTADAVFDPGDKRLERGPDGTIPKDCRHVTAPAQTPAMVGGRMSNQEQFRGIGRRHFWAFQADRNMLCHDRMGKSILITGGARSGKSTLAERMTLGLGRPAIYIATAQAHDAEMADRIVLHQSRRGQEWQTVQEPMDLPEALIRTDGSAPRLVDCLTLWLTNLMLADRDWRQEVDRLAALLPAQSAPVVLVTNEVGAGIVPDNALARAFRDAAGLTNQKIATACDELWFCVAGHPLKVKPA